MKDYRLSEIKEICEEKCNSCSLKEIPCKSCKMQEICKTLNWQKYYRGFSPNNWELEPRDMIDLPCKQALGKAFMAYKWEVFFRLKDGVIGSKLFDTEPEADAFLAGLKGGKQ